MDVKLSRNQIKLICTVYMVFAHVLFSFFYRHNIAFKATYTLGEFVPTLFIYFIAEGYCYTSNKVQYGLRLLIFGILTQPLYYISVVTNRSRLNIIITFALCVFIFYIYEKDWNIALRIIAILPFLILIKFCEGDFLYLGIAIVFYIHRKYDKITLEAAFLTSGTVFVIYYVIQTLILSDNIIMFKYYMCCIPGIMIGYLLLKNHYDTSIRSSSKIVKYAFYIAYPAHFIVLASIHLAQYYGYLPRAIE